MVITHIHAIADNHQLIMSEMIKVTKRMVININTVAAALNSSMLFICTYGCLSSFPKNVSPIEIKIGLNTTHHDQATNPASFRTRKIRNNIKSIYICLSPRLS
jgi:hypothetical protein